MTIKQFDKIVKVVRNGKKATVSWKNIAGETGYQIKQTNVKTARCV